MGVRTGGEGGLVVLTLILQQEKHAEPAHEAREREALASRTRMDFTGAAQGTPLPLCLYAIPLIDSSHDTGRGPERQLSCENDA